MRTIIECQFMRMLLRGTQYDYDSSKLLDAYYEFQSLLSNITDGDLPYRDKYRAVNAIYEALDIKTQKTDFFVERGSNIRDFASMTMRMMQVEIELLEKQLQNPTLFPAFHPAKKVRKGLYWDTDNFSKTALVSLITAMDSLGVCVDESGVRAPFIALIQLFEECFNVELPQPYKTRDIIMGQGNHRLKFLQQLLKALGSD